MDAVPDEAIAGHLDAVNRLAWSEFLIERYDDAIRHATRGVAVARSTGQEQFGPLIVGAQALSSARRGDLAAAAALQEEALETAEVAANAYVMCWVLTISAHVAMETGDLDDARRAAGRAVDLISGLGDSRVAAMARVRLAATRREMGDPAAGTESLVREAGGWELTRIQPGWRVPYAEAMTRVELGARAHRGRREVRNMCRTRGGELGLPVATAIAKRARASMRLATGEAAVATNLALASADAASAAGAPIEAARSHALAGRAHATAGDRTRAVRLLRSAERTFDACGAQRDRGEARHELRRLGAQIGAAGAVDGSRRRARFAHAARARDRRARHRPQDE